MSEIVDALPVLERLEDGPPPEAKFTPEQKQALDKTYTWVKEFFKAAEENKKFIMGGHGLDHTERVAGMTATLSVLEKEEPFLSVLAALLIDIGRTSDDPRSKNFMHGQVSREMASPFLKSLGVLSDGEREIVENAIADHSRRNSDVRPSKVVEIVMDADRLDSLGALGPVRAGATRWRHPLFIPKEGDGQSTADDKIESIYYDFAHRVVEWYGMLWSASARQIARPRVEFLLEFNEEYKKEAGFMHASFDNMKLGEELEE